MITEYSYPIPGGYKVEVLRTDEPKSPEEVLAVIVKDNSLILSSPCRNKKDMDLFVNSFLKSKGLA